MSGRGSSRSFIRFATGRPNSTPPIKAASKAPAISPVHDAYSAGRFKLESVTRSVAPSSTSSFHSSGARCPGRPESRPPSFTSGLPAPSSASPVPPNTTLSNVQMS